MAFSAAKQQPGLRVTPLGPGTSVGTWIQDIPREGRMRSWGIAGSLPRPVSQQAQLAEPEPQRGWTLNWAWGQRRGQGGMHLPQGVRPGGGPVSW